MIQIPIREQSRLSLRMDFQIPTESLSTVITVSQIWVQVVQIPPSSAVSFLPSELEGLKRGIPGPRFGPKLRFRAILMMRIHYLAVIVLELEVDRKVGHRG